MHYSRSPRCLCALGVAGLVVVLVAGQARLAATDEVNPFTTYLPEAIARDAVGLVRVNDMAWLTERLIDHGGLAGLHPDSVTAALSNVLFNCRDLRGHDISRPSLVAWRRNGSMVMALPLRDARQFLEGFGVNPLGRSMVLVSEDQGTRVYSLVTRGGVVEYRLLAREDMAFLAASVEECKLLAEHPRLPPDTAAPVSLVWRGLNPPLPPPPPKVGDPLPSQPLDEDGQVDLSVNMWVTALRDEYFSTMDQWRSITAVLGPGESPDQLRVMVQASAWPECALAQFIARQRNQQHRLLNAIEPAAASAWLVGSVAFQGELERLGQRLVNSFRAVKGEGFTTEQATALRNAFAIMDRQGAFAAGLRVGSHPSRHIKYELREAVELPRTDDLLRFMNDAKLLQLWNEGGAVEAVNVGAQSALRWLLPDSQPDHSRMGALLIATPGTLVTVAGSLPPNLEQVSLGTVFDDAATAVANILPTLRDGQGDPSVMRLHGDITPITAAMGIAWVDPAKRGQAGRGEVSPEAIVDAVLVRDGGALKLKVDLPLKAAAQALRASGVLSLLGELPKPDAGTGPGSTKKPTPKR